jgi:thiamine kinase-like enzyme
LHNEKSIFIKYDKEIFIINFDNVIKYLIDINLLSEKDIIENSIKIIECSRRNRNFMVIISKTRGYILKQPSDLNRRYKKTQSLESNIYNLAKSDEFNLFQLIIPKILKFDSSNNILIMELVNNAYSLNELIKTPNSKIELSSYFSLLGEYLATYHKLFDNNSNVLSFLPNKLPGFFNYHKPGPEIFQEISNANLELLKIIQNEKNLFDNLSQLSKQWKTVTLIHGDIKFDNILTFKKPKIENDKSESVHMKIVDWEFSDYGDPAWDIGCVFAETIRYWVYSSYKNIADAATNKYNSLIFSQINQALKSFWFKYCRVKQSNINENIELLERAFKFCSVRLIQNAYEWLYDSSEIPNDVIYTLQVCDNILKDPQFAIKNFIGITINEK